MKNVVLAGAVVLAMTATPASAQYGQKSSGRGMTDQQFVTDVAHDGMAEVELGKLATEKASNEQVKKFGQRMADDHSKAGDELIAQVKALVDIGDQTSGLVSSAQRLAERHPLLGTAPPAMHLSSRLRDAAGPAGLTGEVTWRLTGGETQA